jgi:hypothetical protein
LDACPFVALAKEGKPFELLTLKFCGPESSGLLTDNKDKLQLLAMAEPRESRELHAEFATSPPLCFCSGRVENRETSNCSTREPAGGVMSGAIYLCEDPRKESVGLGNCPKSLVAPAFDDE